MLCFWCKTKAILRAWMLLKGTGTCGVPEISETFNFRRPKVPFFFTMKSQSKTQIPQGSPFFWFLLHSHINEAYHLERIDDDRHSHLSFGSSWAQKKTHRHFKLRSGSNRHVLLSQRCIITYQDAMNVSLLHDQLSCPHLVKAKDNDRAASEPAHLTGLRRGGCLAQMPWGCMLGLVGKTSLEGY